MLRTFLAVLALAIGAVAQPSAGVSGLEVVQVAWKPGEATAAISLRNTSKQPITAFDVGMMDTLPNGLATNPAVSHGYTTDFLEGLLHDDLRQQLLQPGESRTFNISMPANVIATKAEVQGVIFLDRSAEGSRDSIDEMLRVRSEYAAGLTEALNILEGNKGTLSDSDLGPAPDGLRSIARREALTAVANVAKVKNGAEFQQWLDAHLKSCSGRRDIYAAHSTQYQVK